MVKVETTHVAAGASLSCSVAKVAGGGTSRSRAGARKSAGGAQPWAWVGWSTGAAPGPPFPDVAPREGVVSPSHGAVHKCRDAKGLDVLDDRGQGGTSRIELVLDSGHRDCGGRDNRAQFEDPANTLWGSRPAEKPGQQGRGAGERTKGCGGAGAGGRRRRGGLGVAPEMDALQVLVSDPA